MKRDSNSKRYLFIESVPADGMRATAILGDFGTSHGQLRNDATPITRPLGSDKVSAIFASQAFDGLDQFRTR